MIQSVVRRRRFLSPCSARHHCQRQETGQDGERHRGEAALPQVQQACGDKNCHREVEVKERKDRVDDALHATRAAVEEGILPGGGIALLRSLKALDGLKAANDDQQSGIDIVRRALRAPARQIADNAAEDGSFIVGKLLEGEDYHQGFNAATGEYEDLVKAGVIDPAKVVRTALQDAASVASLLITTEALVAELPKDDKASPMPAMDF